MRLPSKGKKEAYLELMAKDEDDNEMQVAETIVPFPVTDLLSWQQTTKTRRTTMLTKAFLSPTEIKERIDQEAASDKERKLTPEQIEAIYSNGSNILVSASAGSENLCHGWAYTWYDWTWRWHWPTLYLNLLR